jgi:hypothetical protein
MWVGLGRLLYYPQILESAGILASKKHFSLLSRSVSNEENIFFSLAPAVAAVMVVSRIRQLQKNKIKNLSPGHGKFGSAQRPG